MYCFQILICISFYWKYIFLLKTIIDLCIFKHYLTFSLTLAEVSSISKLSFCTPILLFLTLFLLSFTSILVGLSYNIPQCTNIHVYMKQEKNVLMFYIGNDKILWSWLQSSHMHLNISFENPKPQQHWNIHSIICKCHIVHKQRFNVYFQKLQKEQRFVRTQMVLRERNVNHEYNMHISLSLCEVTKVVLTTSCL